MICIIGHFGFGQTLLNGQTIKTKIVTTEIQKQFGEENVVCLDLAGGLKKIPSLIFKVPGALRKCDDLIMMPAENGLRFLTPLLRFWSKFFKRRLHYVVIGGWLPNFVSEKEQMKKGLKRFHGVYVETNTMKSALEAQGFENVFVMPNCKKLTILSEKELVYPSDKPYKICTFSRVMKEKGIETAVNVIKQVNDSLGYIAYSLDIYGQVDENQTEWFDLLQKEFPSYIRYGGSVPFDKSVDVLKDYFALLFPTYYEGEGFAGTLIDAFSAGVPVIASDWKYNSELVNESVGCVCPTEDWQAFFNILKEAAIKPELFLGKRSLCLKEAEKYRIDKAVAVLIKQLKSMCGEGSK